MPLLSSLRPATIEDAYNGDYTSYVQGIGYLEAPLVLLLIAIPFVLSRTCCGKRHSFNPVMLIVMAMLAGGAAIAMLLMLVAVRQMPNDANNTIDAVLGRMSGAISIVTQLRDDALDIAPQVEAHMATNGTIDSMQPLWDNERQLILLMSPELIVNESIIQGQIDAILQARQQITQHLTLNNSDALQRVNDSLDQMHNAVDQLQTHRQANLLSLIYLYPLYGILGLIGLCVLSVVLASWPSGALFALIPASMQVIFIILLFTIAIALGDGCDWLNQAENRYLTPDSNITNYRIGYACLHNTSLLVAANVNTTLILNLDQLVTFPDFPAPAEINPAPDPVLEALRINSMKDSLQLVLDTRGIVHQLFVELNADADQAVCGNLADQFNGFRDDTCKLALSFEMVVLFTALFVISVLVTVMWSPFAQYWHACSPLFAGYARVPHK